MNQLESLDDYLDAMPGGSDPDPDFAAKVRGVCLRSGSAGAVCGDADCGLLVQTMKKIIQHIQAENKLIDLGAIEDGLESQDRSSNLFYGGDDLSRDQVIAAAQAPAQS